MDGSIDQSINQSINEIFIAAQVIKITVRTICGALNIRELRTDLDASLPLEVDASQVNVVVDSGNVRLDRFADKFISAKILLTVLLEV